jgi:hypothetical protein
MRKRKVLFLCTPNMAHSKNVCPARNSTVPPSVSATEASVPCSPGCATVSSSAAAMAMIPATSHAPPESFTVLNLSPPRVVW